MGDLSAKFSGTGTELSQSVAMWNKDYDSFVVTDKELLETTEVLSSVQEEIKRAVAFVQSQGGNESTLERPAMNAVVESPG